MSVIQCRQAGLLRTFVKTGNMVEKGELLAEIIDPYNGEVSEEITAPKKGRIFFQRDSSLVYAGAVVFKQI